MVVVWICFKVISRFWICFSTCDLNQKFLHSTRPWPLKGECFILCVWTKCQMYSQIWKHISWHTSDTMKDNLSTSIFYLKVFWGFYAFVQVRTVKVVTGERWERERQGMIRKWPRVGIEPVTPNGALAVWATAKAWFLALLNWICNCHQSLPLISQSRLLSPHWGSRWCIPQSPTL